jgi:GNAT superfamily N-acetyltransferase
MDASSQALISLLDELAANAWPARVQQALEGWRLRATGGVTRRANSVFTAAPLPAYAGWLESIEEFYRRRGLPPRFQISDGSPEGLDAFLEAHDYEGEAYSLVQTAGAQVVAESARAATAPRVIESADLEEEWLEAYMAIEGAPDDRKDAYRSIYKSIGPRACYVRVLMETEDTGAVGLAVTERGWTGLFSIATRPEYRGRGLASRVIQWLFE